MKPYYTYWAKTNYWTDEDEDKQHLLPYHLLDVAACLKIMLDRHPSWLSTIASILGKEESDVLPALVFLAAIHDLGKFSDIFQGNSEVNARFSNEPENIRHDTAGFDLLMNKLRSEISSQFGPFECKRTIAELLAPVMGHHGYPPRSNSDVMSTKNLSLNQFTDQNIEDALLFLKDLDCLFEGDLSLTTRADRDRLKKASWLIAGVIEIADWIGSDVCWKNESDVKFHHYDQPISLQTYWSDIALPTARRRVEHTGVVPSEMKDCDPSFESLYDFDPRPMQEWSNRVELGEGSHLFIIENMTGSGKTEAALTLSHRLFQKGEASGLYFALPTQTASNQVFGRVWRTCERLFDPEDPGTLTLAHGNVYQSKQFRDFRSQCHREYAEGESVELTNWLADDRKQAILSQIGVGTIDQSLISMLRRYHQPVRLAGLSGKVFIVDEVHAYEMYQQNLLENLLEAASTFNFHVILLSATLHSSAKKRLIGSFSGGAEEHRMSDGFPTATRVTSDGRVEQTETDSFEQKEVWVDLEVGDKQKNSEERVLDYLIHSREEEFCACWMRNTVKDAIDGYRKLKDRIGSDQDLILAHSEFTRGDRRRIDKKAEDLFGKDSGSEKRDGKIVVCTQVFEQSLDLDFDRMVSDLAPIDVLLQRIGRLCRHIRNADGDVIGEGGEDTRVPLLMVHAPPFKKNPTPSWFRKKFESASFVYSDTAKLWKTAKLIREHNTWSLPDQARMLLEAVYEDDGIETPQNLRDKEMKVKNRKKRDVINSHQNSINLDKDYFRDGMEKEWDRDVSTPTRLGDPTRTFRIGQKKGDSIAPINDSWSDSEIDVSMNDLSTPIYRDEAEKIKEKVEDMKERGNVPKWIDYLILNEDKKARGMNEEGKTGLFKYSSEIGFQKID